jgi:hypothetical protein
VNKVIILQVPFGMNIVWITFSWGGGVRFEVYTAVKIHVKFVCVVTPCNAATGYKRFGGPCCIHLQGESYKEFRS